MLSGALNSVARLGVAVSVADGAALPNGEEGASTDDDGGGGSGKDDSDDDDDDHAGASVVESIHGVDHVRTEIMINFLHVWSLVVSIPHIVVSYRVFSCVRQNRYKIPIFATPFHPPL